MIYLDEADLLHIASRVLGDFQVRDGGLLAAAVARPRASVGGTEAYPGVHEKAAALVHSLVSNHALVDGNKRLGLAGLLAFYGMNGRRVTMSNDQAYDLIMDIAAGELDDVSLIAARLEKHVR